MKNRGLINRLRQVCFYALLPAVVALAGCGENSQEMYDRWMSELNCPVILEGKTDKAVNNPTIVVRDGQGRLRTIEYYDSYLTKGHSNMAAAIADSREIGDTLKPCVGTNGR